MNSHKARQVQEKAKRLIPGISQLLSKRPDQFSTGVWPAYFSKAKGVDVWDLDDNKYMDMSIGGIGATVLGYADPDVDNAVITAIRRGVASSLNCPEEVELADLLCQINPWADMARFARSGGEAMTVAVRIARAFSGKDKVAFCGYHGWHDWYLSANIATDDALEGHLLPGLKPAGVPACLKGTALPFKYNCMDELNEIVQRNKDGLAAIVMEPVRNIQPENDFLNKVRECADNNGLVLIFDEISSGFRLNSTGAHALYGVDPDIAVYSKAMGNGYPVAAVVGRKQIMEAAQSSFISSTCWTERTGPVAALATIKKHIEKDVAQHLIQTGKMVQAGWIEAAQRNKLDIEIGGIPPLSHFTFMEQEEHAVLKAFFVQEMLSKGILASNIFYAMYAHTADHVNRYLAAVDDVFACIHNIKAQGKKVVDYLSGEPAVSGFKRLN